MTFALSRIARAGGIAAVTWLALSTHAHAHGVVGQRFFPATIATEDPIPADELALPTASFFRHNEDGEPVNESEYEFEWSKTIVRGFAISIEGGWSREKEFGEPAEQGWHNFEVTPTLEVMRDEDAEFVASLALSWEIGATGSSTAERTSTYTPRFLFGKGFGDAGAEWVKPFAVTGSFGYAVGKENVFEWGGAIQYSLPYLKANVRDTGMGEFLSRLTPIVELAFATPEHGKTTGTINPGLLWSGQYMQLGVEAIVPVNRETGRNIGVLLQMHFYVDDIFPQSLGRPLFGGQT